MVCFTLRFPLGVYHALADRERGATGAEWAPSPVRLIGALLAAAHEIPSDDVDADRAAIQRLCDARPPIVFAPEAVPLGDQDGPAADAVAALRGPSRWAPRNPGLSEMKGASPHAVGALRAEVDKGGVAIGDLPVTIAWPDVEPTEDERKRLARLAGDVAWLGTSRSPVLVSMGSVVPEAGATSTTRWSPLPYGTFTDRTVRVPNSRLIDAFDHSFAARRAKRDKVESSGQMRPTAGGDVMPYAPDRTLAAGIHDPRHWGHLAVLEIEEDGLVPRTPGTYVVARALRAALMDTFAERGDSGDAPAILHGHDGAPHLAIVPLPHVGHPQADGRLRGIALVFPHPDRLEGDTAEEQLVESALREFLPEATPRRPLRVPGAAALKLKAPDPLGVRRWALSPTRYTGPARVWETVTPIVHSRWRKRGPDALATQVAADCAHVGLPVPVTVELLRTSAVTGGASRLVPSVRSLPEDWRKSLQGQTGHVRIEFDRPVAGPVLLGRARHFGVGLCVPGEDAEATDSAQAMGHGAPDGTPERDQEPNR